VVDINEFLLSKLDKLDEKLDGIREEQLLTKVALNSHEDRDKEIHEDVKMMGSDLKKQCKQLGEYNQSLKEHMRRTEMLENKVEPMFVEFQDKKLLAEARNKKLKKWAKIIGAISVVVGIIAGIAQIISVL